MSKHRATPVSPVKKISNTVKVFCASNPTIVGAQQSILEAKLLLQIKRGDYNAAYITDQKIESLNY